MRDEEFAALREGDLIRIALADIPGLAIVTRPLVQGGASLRCRPLVGYTHTITLMYASSVNEVVSLTDEEQALVMKYNLGL